MSTVIDLMQEKISLHGLGFIQVQLEANQRLHVWHPALPKRRCFEDSAVHDHRFGFVSRILVGVQRNIEYQHSKSFNGEFQTYLHEGKRMPGGSRPWTADGKINLAMQSDVIIRAGEEYVVDPYVYHRTEPQGDGRVATLMTKTYEGTAGAHSTCKVGVKPHTDFDRFQLSPKQLWQFVFDVLGK